MVFIIWQYSGFKGTSDNIYCLNYNSPWYLIQRFYNIFKHNMLLFDSFPDQQKTDRATRTCIGGQTDMLSAFSFVCFFFQIVANLEGFTFSTSSETQPTYNDGFIIIQIRLGMNLLFVSTHLLFCNI